MDISSFLSSLNIKHDVIWEDARFKTFKKWPFKRNAKCLPIKMAEAGWYCSSTDRDDPAAMCAFCFKELSGWEPQDDPWEEHSKHSQDCFFLKLNKKKEADLTVEDIYRLLEVRILKILEVTHAEKQKKLDELKDKVLEYIDKM